MSESSIQDDDPYAFRSLTDSQKTVLAVLPIPSALLSIFGSVVIIYMACLSRKSKAWTPYNRLLVAMSTYDIITSIALGASPFLYPKETSRKALVYGNDASCTAVGFLNQLSYSGTLYNGFLSVYFLLTARFGMQNSQIARRIEPAMHIFSIGYPTLTGFVGLFLGVYAEPESGLGCWVNGYPKQCGYGPDGTGEPCLSGTIGWIFGGWVACLTLALLVVDNLVISWYVFRQTRGYGKNAQSRRSTMEIEDDESSVKRASIASSFRSTPSPLVDGMHMTQNTASQRKRLRLVSSQAFLFVASYIVSNGSTVLLRLFESQAATYVEEKEMPYKHYVLMVLQACLLPLQGLFNMMVYIRPKYIKNRNDLPRESRIWALRRAVWGAKVEPVHSLHLIGFNQNNNNNSQVGSPQNERDRISSLTNSPSIDSTKEGKQGRREAGNQPRSSRSIRSTRGSNSLEKIPESDNSVSIPGTQRAASIGDEKNGSAATIMMDGSILQCSKAASRIYET